jgi:hypothetical protein
MRVYVCAHVCACACLCVLGATGRWHACRHISCGPMHQMGAPMRVTHAGVRMRSTRPACTATVPRPAPAAPPPGWLFRSTPAGIWLRPSQTHPRGLCPTGRHAPGACCNRPSLGRCSTRRRDETRSPPSPLAPSGVAGFLCVIVIRRAGSVKASKAARLCPFKPWGFPQAHPPVVVVMSSSSLSKPRVSSPIPGTWNLALKPPPGLSSSLKLFVARRNEFTPGMYSRVRLKLKLLLMLLLGGCVAHAAVCSMQRPGPAGQRTATPLCRLRSATKATGGNACAKRLERHTNLWSHPPTPHDTPDGGVFGRCGQGRLLWTAAGTDTCSDVVCGSYAHCMRAGCVHMTPDTHLQRNVLALFGGRLHRRPQIDGELHSGSLARRALAYSCARFAHSTAYSVNFLFRT